MNISIIAFDEFTDIDVFFMWDLLKRIRVPGWTVQILGEKSHHTSTSGLTIPMHGSLGAANSADAVLFASGPGTRKKISVPLDFSSAVVDLRTAGQISKGGSLVLQGPNGVEARGFSGRQQRKHRVQR